MNEGSKIKSLSLRPHKSLKVRRQVLCIFIKTCVFDDTFLGRETFSLSATF